MQAKYNMTVEENIFVARRNLVDYIWKSANLEGIGVTYPDTQAIYHGVSVAGYSIDDINAVNDLKYAWQYLLNNINKPLDLEYIKKVHMILGKVTVIGAGAIRRFGVSIGGADWKPSIPDEKQVDYDIQNILNSGNDKQDIALDVMLYLMRGQLFYGGNKRIAMLICNKIMIENGMGIVSISQKYIKDFYALLVEFYETGISKKLKQFIYDNCIDGMQL